MASSKLNLNGYFSAINHYVVLTRDAFKKDCYHGWQTRRETIMKDTLNSFRELPRIKDVATVCDEEAYSFFRECATVRRMRLYSLSEELQTELLERIAQGISTLPQSF